MCRVNPSLQGGCFSSRRLQSEPKILAARDPDVPGSRSARMRAILNLPDKRHIKRCQCRWVQRLKTKNKHAFLRKTAAVDSVLKAERSDGSCVLPQLPQCMFACFLASLCGVCVFGLLSRLYSSCSSFSAALLPTTQRRNPLSKKHALNQTWIPTVDDINPPLPIK